MPTPAASTAAILPVGPRRAPTGHGRAMFTATWPGPTHTSPPPAPSPMPAPRNCSWALTRFNPPAPPPWRDRQPAIRAIDLETTP